MKPEIPPIPPASREPNAETIARSQWELANAPMRTSGEFAVAWARGIPRAVDDATRDFADERIRRQFIAADSYPVDGHGELIDPIDGSDVDQNLWLLAQLTEPRAIPEVRMTALRTGTRLVNRVIAEASAEHATREREAAHRRQTEALRERAEHDPLTGLYNRRAWQNQVVDRAEIGRPRAIVVIDCDGFKLVNDVLGHQRGDQVLFELGALFRANSRETDLVARMHQPPEVVHAEAPYRGTREAIAARIGGDEFAVALDVTPQDDAAIPAARAAEGEAPVAEDAQGPVETSAGPLPRR
ncbi:MAG TPA: GGDEF domain-containing protein, partial [Candidatus Saccharimonadales bacterium]